MFHGGMKPLYARPLTDEEQQVLQQHLKSADGFAVRRAQMLLMSAEDGLKVEAIAKRVGCHGQTVRVKPSTLFSARA